MWCACITLGLLLCIAGVLCAPPQVLSSTYTVESASILGSDISLAVFTVEFDQDLYVPDITSPCREQTDACNPESFGACGAGCDYTHHGCANANTSNPCCNYALYCENVEPWEDLKNGTAARHLLMNAESRYYRFYNPDPCGPVTMHVAMRSGLVLSYGSRMEPAGPETNDWAIPTPWRPLYHFYCPHNSTSLAGTYFFTYKGKGDNADFEVTVASYLHEPDTAVHPQCTVPDDYPYATDETHEAINTPQELTACLQPNTPFHGVCEHIDANYLFLYKINSCQKLHVQLSLNTIGLDADIYGRIHDSQKDSDFLLWDYVSYLEGDDYLSMSLCGSESDPIYLTIIINCWSVQEPSNFTLIVANQSDTTFRAVPISNSFPYWEVVETAGLVRFLLPNSNPVANYTTSDWLNTFACTDYSFTCYQLWPVYPSDDVNYFWPTPAFLITQLRNTELDTLQLNISQANPRRIKFAVLLRLEVDGSMQYFLEEDKLPLASFFFYGKIVNAQGLPVFGQYSAKVSVPTCNYTTFMALKSQTEALIQQLGAAEDPSTLQKAQYQLDSVRFSEVWVGCVNLLNGLFQETVTVYNRTTTNCNYPYQSEAWYNDGCCFTGIGWNAGCLPRYENVTVPRFEIDDYQVDSQCTHPTCAKGLLEFYQLTLEDYYAGDSACTSTLDRSSTDYLINTIEKYRKCKTEAFTEINSTHCYTDSDCVFAGVGNFTCDIHTGKCKGNFNTQELHFVTCLIQQMDQSQVVAIQKEYGLPNYVANNPAFAQALLGRWRANDCVGSDPLDFSRRSYYYYDNFQPDCPASTFPPCPYIICEDTSCAIPEDSCLNFCDNFYWHFVPGSSSSDCQENVQCNWNSTLCEGLNSTDCAAACGTDSFCGVCNGDQSCVELPASNSSECTALTPCLLPDGSITTTLSETDCEATTTCSHTCGYTCVGREMFTQGASGPLCVSYTATEATCQTLAGAVFHDDVEANHTTCTVMGLTELNCTNLTSNDTWEYISCSDIDTASCFGNYMCELHATECSTPAECAKAGSCSDEHVLVDLEARRYGACRQDKALPVDIYFRYKLLPLCEPPLFSIPNGCVDTSYLTAEECESHDGMHWILPATNGSQCEAEQGCYEYYPELGIVGYQFAFSPKDYDTCTNFGTGGTWKSYYTWTPAQSVHGNALTSAWTARKPVHTHNYASSLNFTAAYESFLASATIQLALQSKSTALCKYSRTIQSLSAITCNCLPENTDNDQCFQEIGDVVTVAQVQACGGSAKEIQSTGVLLYFSENSLSGATCSNVVVSSLTAAVFHDVGALKLASSFAKLDILPQAFAITNEHKAVVGTLLGDGVQISVDKEVSNVLLCLDIDETSISSKYSTFDFGYSNAQHTKLRPYGLTTAYVQNGTVLCAVVNLTTDSPTFLPIVRLANWESKKFRLYDESTEGLIYTLAVLFTVTAAITLITLGFLIIKNPQSSFSITHLLLVMVYLFTLVRAVSLFLMPAGISSTVLNYVLVVLPTFFYFTAFTLAVIIWAVLSKSVSLRPQQQIKQLGVVVNTALYLFFIVVVIAFHYTGDDADTTCGFVAARNSYSSAQRAISIVYAVVIAGISLVIGILFLVYGYRVNEIMTNFRDGKGSARSARMYTFALIYSVSFILHCIFTIVLETLDEPEVVFSFIGLTVTEVLPSFYLSWFLGISKKMEKSSSSELSPEKHTTKSSYNSKSSNNKSSNSNSKSSQSSSATVYSL